MSDFSPQEQRIIIRALRLVVSHPRYTSPPRIAVTMDLLSRLREEWGIEAGQEDAEEDAFDEKVNKMFGLRSRKRRT